MYVESRKNGTDKPICRAGIEKRLVNRAGEGESGTNREKRWHTCITLCETGSGKLQCNTGSSSWSPVITWRGGGGVPEGGTQGTGRMCTNSQFMLLHGKTQHDMVKQLSSS